MNEQLQQALAEILAKATQSAEQAGEFVVAELPDVAQQLLWWKMAESILVCLLGVILWASIIVYWRVVLRNYKQIEGADLEGPVVGLGLVCAAAAFVGGIFCFNLAWLQILIAPKVYLIEYAAQLMK